MRGSGRYPPGGDWRSAVADEGVAEPGLLAGGWRIVAVALESERDRWFLWIPVFLGIGTGAYFGLADEPSWALALAPLLAACGFYALARSRPTAVVFAMAALWAALGFANAKLHAVRVEGPVLTRSTGVVWIRGWVEDGSPRFRKGTRLTVRLMAIEGFAKNATPYRVRITVRFNDADVAAGAAIRLRAVLRPVPEPVAPGGFDFARKAWFERLGGVGFAIGRPELLTGAPEPPWDLRLWAHVDHLRDRVAARIASALPGDAGAVVTALITGERAAIPDTTLNALRHSGLAHVLAISGLHMAMMAGTLYALVRAFLALFPGLALRFPIKKWAALLALAGAAFYLALSGAGIATQRAFLMTVIAFMAVLLDRPVLTLRNVAVAALCILMASPESLLNVSFQMSFAAVVALVAVYEVASSRRPPERKSTVWARGLLRGWRYMCGIGLTTLVASLATAPFAAFHFHKLAQYGLLGNLAAMPIVGLVVMPMALLALLAMPLGLEAGPLWVMARGIEALTDVAETVSGLEGAVVHVAAMPTHALVLLVSGGLWLCLWRRRWRSAGLVIAALGVATAGDLPRADILVEREGKTLAVRTGEGRLAIPARQRVSYSIDKWLLADGDGGASEVAARATAYVCDEHACLARVKGKSVAFLRHPAALWEECRKADIIISQFPFRRSCPKARVIVDKSDFRAEGAHAIYVEGQSIRVETVSRHRGRRPWVRSRPRKSRRAATSGAQAKDRKEPN